jgi:hypothetical protein
MSRYTRTGSGIPVFFKLWFAVCAIVSATIFAAVIFLLYTIISDPAVVGRFAGEIVHGYSQTANDTEQ